MTYSRKVFIPLTMLCRDHCHYCTFAKPPAQARRARSSRPTRPSRSPRPGREMGARRRCSRSATGRRTGTPTPAVARERGLRLHAGLRARRRDPRDRGDRPAAAPESRRDVLRGDRPAEAGRASMGIMLETLERPAHASAAVRTSARRTRCPPCACERSTTPAGSRSRSPPASSSASARPSRERAESLLAIRDLHRRYRHVQEVIVQNFRAKPGTAMHARAGARRRRVRGRGRDRAGRAGAAHARPGAAEPVATRRSGCGCSTPASTTGAASRRSRPTT